MARPKTNSVVPDPEIKALIERYGIQETAKRTGLDIRGVNRRRRNIERKLNVSIYTPHEQQKRPATERFDYVPHHGRVHLEVEDGIVVVAGDCHYWPGEVSLMHRALVAILKDLKPKAIILNGDVCDFGMISRHPRIGWEKLPDVADEVEGAKERLWEIERAAFKARKIWPLGNHDSRFSTNLANHAPEYAGIHGTQLRDHFPLWEPCWRCDINFNNGGSRVIVKHRGKGGIHSIYNNCKEWGVTAVTGHDHCPYVRPYTDANGTRYAINHGCIADPDLEGRICGPYL
jgi:hypothetical protein